MDCANLASPESPEPRALRVATAPAVERWLRFCFEDFVESVEDSERSPTIPFWILAEEPCLAQTCQSQNLIQSLNLSSVTVVNAGHPAEPFGSVCTWPMWILLRICLANLS